MKGVSAEYAHTFKNHLVWELFKLQGGLFFFFYNTLYPAFELSI